MRMAYRSVPRSSTPALTSASERRACPEQNPSKLLLLLLLLLLPLTVPRRDTATSGVHAILYGSDPFSPLSVCRTLLLNRCVRFDTSAAVMAMTAAAASALQHFSNRLLSRSGGAGCALPPKTHDDGMWFEMKGV
jgi:hypothetical protein